MKRGLFLLLATVLFTTANVSAVFSIGNASNQIQSEYLLGEQIKGWINLSMSGVSISSKLTSSLGGSINLMDLFFLNGITPTCIPTDCKSDYATVSGSGKTSEEFVLNDGESKILGFKIGQQGPTGFTRVNWFRANVASNATESTEPQLHIELVRLDDNLPEWSSYVSSGNYYSEIKGCYDSNPIGTSLISLDKYCNKIGIVATPKIEIGAYILPETGGNANFLMSVQEASSGIDIGSCSASTTSGGRISCTMDLKSSEFKDYFVCIQSASGSESKYKINREGTQSCGFSGDFQGSYFIDFDIFSKASKFQSVGSFILNNSELAKYGSHFQNIEEEIGSYIAQKYNNNCSKECVVPIKFTSGIDGQKINISNISINYYSGTTETETNIYNVTQTPATMSTGFVQLDLKNANFSAPSSFGNHSLKLIVDGQEIFSKSLSIAKIPQIVSILPNPLRAAAAYPQKFIINAQGADANTTITKYEWDFGDGSMKQTTSTNITEHTYNSIGTFKINITVTDSNLAKTTRTFDVVVQSPRDNVNEVFPKKVSNFGNIKTFIESQPSFYQNAIKNAINFNSLEGIVSELQQRNAAATTDADYVSIMSDLLDLQIPESINITESANGFLFYTEKDSINLNVISEIGGEDYNVQKEDVYLDAIVSWNLNNVITKVNFKDFSGIYSGEIEGIVNTFEINIEKNALRDSALVVIPKMEGLNFKEDYGQKEKAGHYYIELTDAEKNIEFSTTDNIGLLELPLFISPRIGQFSNLIEYTPEERAELSKKTLMILFGLLIIFIGFFIYFIVHELRKRRYEKTLFGTRKDLYNIVLFVQNSKKRGMDPREISNNLRRSGWGPEQINYVMKRYSSRIGIANIIPVHKIFSVSGNKDTHPQNNRQNYSNRQNNRFIGNTKI